MNDKIRRGSLLAAAASTHGGADNDFYNPNPNYLTIVALEDGLTASLSTNAVEYSIDGNDNWTTLTADTASPTINTGQYISFRGNLTPTSSDGVGTFTILKSCNLTGNCNSILFGDDASTNLDLTGYDSCYFGMFSNCPIVEVSLTFLPATTLAEYCYGSMFVNCKSLTTAPELPATTLADICYSSMFYGCTSLTTAPELPATTLAYICYGSMFVNCKSLTTAPELPATTLADYCYRSMFSYCTSLTTAPELPATTLANSCYYYMFDGCTSLTTAPELPATTLAYDCYAGMFYGCSKLNYIKALFTTTPSSSYTSNWVYGVASSGTFVKNKNATWNVTSVNGIPSGWTVEIYEPFTPQQCLSLSIEADDISGKQSLTTVYYTATVKGLDENNNTITKIITGTDTVEVGQNTSTTNSVTKTVSYTYMGVTATTTITQGVYNSSYYTVNLNSQWQLSTTVASPGDITVPYDGVYESYSNKGTANSGASMYININGYSTFKFYIRSYAESNYDYVMVSQLDKTLTYSSSYSDTTLVKAHTRGKQQSGTALSNYTLVEFTNIDGGAHTIQIIYRKDSSQNSNDDRGYVIIPRNQ